MRRRGKNKKGIVIENLIPWLIALAVLITVIFFIVILKGQGISLIDKIKGIFGG